MTIHILYTLFLSKIKFTRIQEYKNTRIQEYKNTRIQEYTARTIMFDFANLFLVF